MDDPMRGGGGGDDRGRGRGRGGRGRGGRGDRYQNRSQAPPGRGRGGRASGRAYEPQHSGSVDESGFQRRSEIAHEQRHDQQGGRRGGEVPGRTGPAEVQYGSGSASSAVESLVPRVRSLEVKETSPSESALASSTPSSSKSLTAAPRPDRGTAGSKTLIRVNHFKMDVKAKTIFHYDVSIHPAVGSKGIARALEQQLVLQYRASDLNNRLPVYDGSKSLYTAGPLPFEHRDFKVVLPEHEGRKAREFKVTIKLAATLDQHQVQLFLASRITHFPQEFIQALDVALRELPTKSFAPSGRKFFDPSFGRQALENGFEAWKGFYQSVRLTMQGLVVNVDLSATAFYEPQEVLEFLKKSIPYFSPNKGLSDAERLKIKKLLSRLKVEVTHRPSPRRYRIAGVSSRPTKALTFTADDSGKELKVVDYFWEAYRYKIQYPELPCLELQGRKTTYLPMEVCKLAAGQKYQGKLNERQTTNMLRFTCQNPVEREGAITSLMSRVHDFQRNEYAREFGVSVDSKMTSLSGRILPPPNLRYGNNEVAPRRGDWNMMQSKFLTGGEIHRWTLVNFTRITPQDVNYFINALMKRCGEVGISMSPPMVAPSSGRLEQYDTLLRNAVRNCDGRPGGNDGLQLIVCLMDGRHPLYGDLKKLCETELGVITQCCLKKNVMKNDRDLSQYLANLAMKINVKVGGQNMTLSQELPRMLPAILGTPTIIFGADVSHPMARDETSPSISAVVASVDWPSSTKYLAAASAQTHRVERIEALEGMVMELLRAFYARTRRKPEKILFFRDGVSEGQFYDVLSNEVRAIRVACAKLEANYSPPITFVVVQKRHHTRFFPADRNVVNNNVCPGTVVDTDITHPREFDFYLCSHKGLQGTSRPTHYHVLLDQNGFKADELQMLINNLCYTYARCTKAVSVVPPAYYAHLVAYRARLYVETSGSGSEGTGGASSSARGAAAEFNRSMPVKDAVKNYMYYC